MTRQSLLKIEDARIIGWDVHGYYPMPEEEGHGEGIRYEWIDPDGRTSADSFETELDAWDDVLQMLNTSDVRTKFLNGDF